VSLYPKEKPLTPTAKHIAVQEKDPTNQGSLTLEVESYYDGIPPLARQLALLGLSNNEIAETFGISRKCFAIWLEEYGELQEVIFDGRNFADARVAEALYSRAVGYDYTEDRTYIDRGTGVMKKIKISKHIPADVAAAKLWLQSRREEWKEKKEVTHTVVPKKKLTELFDDFEVVEGEFTEDDD